MILAPLVFQKNLKSILIPVGLLLFFGISQSVLQKITTGSTAIVEAPPQYLGLSIDSKVIKNFLGIRLLVADLLWIDALVKADITKEPMPFGAFYRAFDTIMDLDPDHLYGYYVSGIYLSVIKDDYKGATKILRRGVDYIQDKSKEFPWIKQLPSAWMLPYALGYNLIFEEHEFDEGGKWIQYAATLPEAPAYVQGLAQLASTEHGRLELGARVLGDLRKRLVKEDEIRAVEEKMLKIAVMQEVLLVNEEFQKFISNTGSKKPSDEKSANRLFQLFLRQNGRPGKDLLGRPFVIDESGKISIKPN